MTGEIHGELNIKNILLDIKSLLEKSCDEDKNDIKYEDDEDPYVTIKLRLNSDKLKLLTNEYKIYSLIRGMLDFKRELYKYGYPDKEIIVKDNKVIDKDKDRVLTPEELKGRKCYIEESFIVDQLDNLLETAYEILNDEY